MKSHYKFPTSLRGDTIVTLSDYAGKLGKIFKS